jgi:hypothetical protein
MSNNTEAEDQFGGIFDVSVNAVTGGDGFDEGNSGERNPDFYGPSLKNKNVKDNVYKSRIRFVPNVNDRNLQKVSKWIFYLPDPNNEERSFYVDCPNDGKNIVTQAFFFLKDHDSKVLRDLAKRFFSRKRYHWSLVQVMIDGQDPESEGKIKILRFGNQINEMIDIQGVEDSAVGKKAVVVYDPFRGKDFVLFVDEKKVGEGNKTITSYEKSYFDDKLTSMSFDKTATRTEDTPEERMKIFKFLKEQSPDLSQCVHQEWDDQMEEKVIASIQSVIGDDSVFDAIFQKTYGKGKKFVGKSSPNVQSEGVQSEGVQSEGVAEAFNKEEKEDVGKKSTTKATSTKAKATMDESATPNESAALKEKVSATQVKEKIEEKTESAEDNSFDDMNDFNFDDLPTE